MSPGTRCQLYSEHRVTHRVDVLSAVFDPDEPSRDGSGTARVCIRYEPEEPLSVKKPANLLDALVHSDLSSRKDQEVAQLSASRASNTEESWKYFQTDNVFASLTVKQLDWTLAAVWEEER